MSTQMPEPSHEEIQELLGAYALDAVDKETAALVERHLDECVRCSTEVAQHHEVAGLLANSGGTSPADLWDGIASRLDDSEPPSWEGLAGRLETGGERTVPSTGESAPESAPESATPSAAVIPMAGRDLRHRWAFRVAGIAAAAALVVAVALGLQVHHLHNQVSALQSQPSLSAIEQSALKEPSTHVVALTAAAGSAAPHPAGAVTVVLTRSGTGFVEAAGLSTLPDNRTYQLWGVIGGEAISLGLLGSSPKVVPFSVAGDAAVHAFAITAEHSGGVVHSTNSPIVAGTVTT
jgi:anti-sigma factor RsiW